MHVKQFYWYNTRTGLSMWHRPRILGKHDPLLTPRSRKVAVAHGMKVRTKTPRYKATDMEPAFAATVIQCAFRCFKAQKVVIAHAQRVYQKGYDSEADCFFYFNTRTNTSQWHKPSFLHSADVDLTPRSFIGARRSGHVVTRSEKPLSCERLVARRCTKNYLFVVARLSWAAKSHRPHFQSSC